MNKAVIMIIGGAIIGIGTGFIIKNRVRSLLVCILALTIWIGFCFVAFAQDITLKVTPNELNIIGQGLEAQQQSIQALVGKLRQQYIDQQPKPVEAPKVEPVPGPK